MASLSITPGKELLLFDYQPWRITKLLQFYPIKTLNLNSLIDLYARDTHTYKHAYRQPAQDQF